MCVGIIPIPPINYRRPISQKKEVTGAGPVMLYPQLLFEQRHQRAVVNAVQREPMSTTANVHSKPHSLMYTRSGYATEQLPVKCPQLVGSTQVDSTSDVTLLLST